MRNHQPGCPRLQFWDAGEYEAPCYCFDPTPKERLKDDIMDLISWLDNAPFLMGKLTERDKATREKIIAIIMGGAR